MTFHSPTETNPPFTSPPTWPFPTTSIPSWEVNYRLLLLEAAIIYMWANGSPGSPGPPGPTGPPGTVYAIVQGTAPPTNIPPSPPEGLLWIDTATPAINVPGGAAGGDLNGTYPSPTVDGLQGKAVDPTAPTTGQGLVWNGTAWIPTTMPQFIGENFLGADHAIPANAAPTGGIYSIAIGNTNGTQRFRISVFGDISKPSTASISFIQLQVYRLYDNLLMGKFNIYVPQTVVGAQVSGVIEFQDVPRAGGVTYYVDINNTGDVCTLKAGASITAYSVAG